MSRAVLERSLPHSLDAEKSVLGAILANNENFYLVSEHLKPEDFYRDNHRILFKTFAGLIEQGITADLITVQESLLKQNYLEYAGGIAYVAGLLDGIPHLVNIAHYIDIIKEKSTARQGIHTLNKTMSDLFEQSDPAAEVLDRTERELFQITEKRVTTGFVKLGDLELQTTRTLEKMYTERQNVTGISTGFTDLDRMTSGLHASDLVILAARPSMGKTAYALNIAQYVAIKNNQPVGMFSLEMSKEQLLLRVLAADAMVDAHKMRTGYIGSGDLRCLMESLGRVAKAPFFVDDTSHLTVMEMRSKCRRLKAEHGLSLLIVDYLQLMSGYGKSENRNQEVSAISRGLKALAKELNVPVLALSQLSRAPEQRSGDHKPQLSDLRESGSIEQDADTVLFIYRQEVYHPDEDNAGKADLIVAKQRNGPTGVVKLAFLKNFTKFENLLEGY